MHSPKLPINTKFSTTGIKLPIDLIVHNGGSETLAAENPTIGPLLRDYNVIRYCTSGKGVLVINDKQFEISQGQCYVMLAGDVATESVAPGVDNFSLAFVTLLGIKAPSYFSQLGISSQQPFLPWDKNPEFLSLMQEIRNQVGFLQIPPNTEFLRCSFAYKLLHKLQEILLNIEKPKIDVSEHLQEQYVSDALRFMELNFSRKISVSDIAAHIGINRSYFYSLFKQRTGLSPQEHLTRLRISKACDLFAYPHSTVVAVANALGLEASVFFRHFKRIVGKTPTEYKQWLESKQSK